METNPASCRRCGSCRPYIIIDKVHLECRECFLESCNKKIRSAIGKSKLVRNNDAILIAYSGGASSCALLDLIKNSMDSDTRREQKFRPSILHIDTESVLEPHKRLDEFQTTRKRALEELLSRLMAAHPSWPIYWTSIETSTTSDCNSQNFVRYKGSCDNGSHLLSNDDAHMAFHRCLDGMADLTDKQQFVTDKCVQLIARVADEINLSLSKPEDKFKFVFTGSTATQLANDLLVDVILGRGATIRSRVSICDEAHPVPVMRPMRDFSKKELAYYLLARRLEAPVRPNLLTMAERRSSIQTATECFLTKLYVDYPSTYSTLLKTGNKMQH